MEKYPILSLLTFLPLVGAAILLGIPQENRSLARRLALAVSLVSLGLSVVLVLSFEGNLSGLQFQERRSWIPTIGAEYFLGVDGLSLLMVLLTAMVVPMSVIVSWNVQDRAPLYFSLVLMLQAGLFGTFTAFNFFHWFLFWELSLVPAFFLIKLWGGPRRTFAATQFFVYTMAGSVAMLLAFLAIVLATGTFDFVRLTEMARTGALSAALAQSLAWPTWTSDGISLLIFSGIFLGLAVKVPLIPFHSWLPVTYAEAPTATTMLLTGLMSKMGVYGFLRILIPLFPTQIRLVLTPLLWLAVITIVFSACAAFAQRDLKRILAYSSINHLGYCLLGIFAATTATGSEPHWTSEKTAALSGVMLQMFNHGITAAALFCFVALLEKRSGGLRSIDDFGGLRKVAPIFCGLMGISLFASIGLPGLNGFVGEFLIFKGTFSLAAWAAALSTIGLLVTAIFLLTLIQRVFHGPLTERWMRLADLNWSERFLLVPAIATMFVIGIYPQPVFGMINRTVLQMVSQLQ